MGNQNGHQLSYEWEDEYTIIQKTLDNSIVILKKKSFQQFNSNEVFFGRQIKVTDKHIKKSIQHLIEVKTKYPSQNVTKLIKSIADKNRGYCSFQESYHLLFTYPGNTLFDEIIARKQANVKFTQEQCNIILEKCVKGLYWLKQMDHPHSNICTNSIFISDSKEILLGDPWITPSSEAVLKNVSANQFFNYPSYQKIQFFRDNLDTYCQHKSSIFSLGCIILQLLNGESLSNVIYNKNMTIVSEKQIFNKIKLLATDEELKFKLELMLHRNPHKRQEIFMLLSKNKFYGKCRGKGINLLINPKKSSKEDQQHNLYNHQRPNIHHQPQLQPIFHKQTPQLYQPHIHQTSANLQFYRPQSFDHPPVNTFLQSQLKPSMLVQQKAQIKKSITSISLKNNFSLNGQQNPIKINDIPPVSSINFNPKIINKKFDPPALPLTTRQQKSLNIKNINTNYTPFSHKSIVDQYAHQSMKNSRPNLHINFGKDAYTKDSKSLQRNSFETQSPVKQLTRKSSELFFQSTLPRKHSMANVDNNTNKNVKFSQSSDRDYNVKEKHSTIHTGIYKIESIEDIERRIDKLLSSKINERPPAPTIPTIINSAHSGNSFSFGNSSSSGQNVGSFGSVSKKFQSLEQIEQRIKKLLNQENSNITKKNVQILHHTTSINKLNEDHKNQIYVTKANMSVQQTGNQTKRINVDVDYKAQIQEQKNDKTTNQISSTNKQSQVTIQTKNVEKYIPPQIKTIQNDSIKVSNESLTKKQMHDFTLNDIKLIPDKNVYGINLDVQSDIAGMQSSIIDKLTKSQTQLKVNASLAQNYVIENGQKIKKYKIAPNNTNYSQIPKAYTFQQYANKISSIITSSKNPQQISQQSPQQLPKSPQTSKQKNQQSNINESQNKINVVKLSTDSLLNKEESLQAQSAISHSLQQKQQKKQQVQSVSMSETENKQSYPEISISKQNTAQFKKPQKQLFKEFSSEKQQQFNEQQPPKHSLDKKQQLRISITQPKYSIAAENEQKIVQQALEKKDMDKQSNIVQKPIMVKPFQNIMIQSPAKQKVIKFDSFGKINSLKNLEEEKQIETVDKIPQSLANIPDKQQDIIKYLYVSQEQHVNTLKMIQTKEQQLRLMQEAKSQSKLKSQEKSQQKQQKQEVNIRNRIPVRNTNSLGNIQHVEQIEKEYQSKSQQQSIESHSSKEKNSDKQDSEVDFAENQQIKISQNNDIDSFDLEESEITNAGASSMSNSNEKKSNQKENRYDFIKQNKVNERAAIIELSEQSLSESQFDKRYMAGLISPEKFINNSTPEKIEYVNEEYAGGSRYQGYKKNGMRNGKGKFFYSEGSYYDGEWKDNKMHGKGTLYYSTGKVAYDGQWYMDQFHGKGIVYNDQQSSLTGPFDYSDFNKLGESWLSYQGELVSDSRQGKGCVKLVNGQMFIGSFTSDKADGEGWFFRLNGQKVHGIWKNNRLMKKIS